MWLSLGDIIKKKKTNFSFEDGELPLLWQKTTQELNPLLAEYTEYHDIKKDTLYIKVSDNMLIGELDAQKHKIKDIINKKRTTPVKNIKFILS